MASQPATRRDRTPRQRRRELALDTAIAAAVFASSVALFAAGGPDSDLGTRRLDALGVALAALASLPLVAWRRAPLAVFVLTSASSALLNALDYPSGPPLGPTIALFFLARSPEKKGAPRWLVGVVVASMLVVHAGAVGVADDEFPTVPLLFGTLVWGAAWVLGDRVRLRRERIADLEERARRAEREAEREQRLAVAEERTRIARDLHDSAGHAINVILVQAGAARLLGMQDPERARAALETIEEVARETLGEIDQLVRVLREDEHPVDGRETVEPPLGLAAVETLAERHRSAGLAVDVHTRGSRRPLPPGLDQAAYRILQEALTNAARHGEGIAEVEISFGSDVLELQVWNPARGAGEPDPDPGHGLIGMRERAVLLGGSLDAGASNGRFCVRARLPYGEESA